MEYAGCDFTSENYFQESDKTISGITKLTHLIGEILFSIGYRGTFGCDYLVHESEMHFIEINPRYQASTLIPNIHLGNEELIAPHILHILGFIDNSAQITQQLEQYKKKDHFIDFIKPNKPIGFLNIYGESVNNLRSPLPNIEIEEGLSKGYFLSKISFIKNAYFPTKCFFPQL